MSSSKAAFFPSLHTPAIARKTCTPSSLWTSLPNSPSTFLIQNIENSKAFFHVILPLGQPPLGGLESAAKSAAENHRNVATPNQF